MTAEKVAPSPLCIVADIASAIDIERRIGRQRAPPLKDILSKVVSDYNKMCTNKTHRINTQRKGLLYNLLLVCAT